MTKLMPVRQHIIFLFIICSGILFKTYAQNSIDTIKHGNLRFEENKNQWKKNILYKADIAGGNVFLEKDCFTFIFKDVAAINKLFEFKHTSPDECEELTPLDYIIKCHAYKVKFLNAMQDVKISADKPFEGYSNYYKGSDKNNWASKVKSYNKVEYKNLYKNTDLNIYENDWQLKYDIILHPGANADDIQFLYEGADKLYLKNNNLVINTSVNTVTELSPEAFQIVESEKIIIPCMFNLTGNVLSFVFPSGYDSTKELIIDPTLVFSTYSGSAADNWGFTATFDSSGCAYSGGIAFGTGYPVSTGAFQINFAGGNPASYDGGCDIAIIKYNSTGTQRIWASYLGGSMDDLPHSMIVNNLDELVVYGTTGSSDFPVTAGAFDQSFNGGVSVYYDNSIEFSQGIDIFVSKISSDGTQLLASTLVGGSENDGLNFPSVLSYNYGDGARGEIMTDNNNNVYVVSTSNSTDFPVTPAAFQNTPGGGGQDGVVFKMNSDLSGMIWSSYIGGSGADAVYGIVLDNNNDIYVTGGTSSTNFLTTPSTLYTNYLGGTSDGFITKISANGSSILKSTYYGSYSYDQLYLIEQGPSGKIYVFGQTTAIGNTFINNASWASPGGGQFVSKIEPDLNSLIWSTAFGNGTGVPDISPNAFLVDDCYNIYLSGWGGYLNGFGGTSGLPVTSNAFQSTTDGNDFYFLVIDDNASAMVYGSYFGSPSSPDHVDGGTSRFDRKGIIYNAVCAGCGGYDDFPTTPGAWSNWNNSSNCNNAVIKFDFQLVGVMAVANAAPSDTGCAPFTVNFVNNSNAIDYFWDFGDGDTSNLEEPSHTYTATGIYNVMLIAIDSAKCNISDTTYLIIDVLPGLVVNLGNDTSICNSDSLLLDAGNPGITYLWSTGETSQTIIISDTGTYWVQIDNGVCPASDTIIISIPVLIPLVDDTSVCEGINLVLDAGVPGSNYLWSTGETTQTIIAGASGTYWVNVSTGNCNVTDTFHVFIEPRPTVNLGNDTIFCQTVYIILNAGNAGCTYQWSTGATTQTINVDTSGTYWVLVSNAICSGSDSINIAAVYPPYLGIDTIMCGQYYVTLNAGPSHFGFLWSTGENTQTINVTEAGTYWVQIISPNCTVSDTINIEKGGSFSVFFPNTFTPDADNLNDVFKGIGEQITYYDLTIFTRWGQQIFHTSDPETGWDGTFEGKKVQQDIYVWMVDYKTTCTGWNVQHKTGHIFVLR